ncbi:MAG: TVP38/TMEM64 family membrane protein [Succiniclasticum sp.]|jgi:uncharacterized membrane protein YdjX (TVP38/TMEM64 family)
MQEWVGKAALGLTRRHKRQLLVVAYLLVLAVLYEAPGVFHPRSVGEVRAFVASYGALAPLMYIVLYTCRPLLLFPSLILNLAAGILFPPVLGIPCLLLGGLGSATVLFVLTRTGAGASFLNRHGGRWGSRIYRYLSERDGAFTHMLWLRTVPLFPYDAISLVAGCTALPYHTFAVATLLGMLPGAVAFNVVGNGLGTDAGLAASLLSLGAAFGIPLACWYWKKEKKTWKKM